MIIHELPWRQKFRSALVPLLIAIAYIASVTLIREWALHQAGEPMRFLTLIAMPLGLFGFFLPWIARERNRQPFLRSLRDFGYEVCPYCGYWLRGLDQSVTKCPECGSQREPMPDLPEWVLTGTFDEDKP